MTHPPSPTKCRLTGKARAPKIRPVRPTPGVEEGDQVPPTMHETIRPPAGPARLPVRWEAQDLAYLAYIAVILVLLLVVGTTSGRVAHPWRLIGLHLGLAALGLGARALGRRPSAWAQFLRWWYPLILVYAFFQAIGAMIHIIHPAYLDPLMVRADHLIFGREMTTWLQTFARPWLTELMYFFYTSYYFFAPLIGLPLWLRWRRERSPGAGDRFKEYLLAVSLTFWICYLHFLLTPAGGPVFYADYPGGVLHLSGGPITAFEQWLFATGGMVGGAFPSSHVAMALVSAAYAVRYRIAPWFFIPAGIGLGISTMYHGYHYGVDVLWGAGVAAIMTWWVPRLFAWYERRPA
jgi:membrane-associated phospholipid phosphatase